MSLSKGRRREKIARLSQALLLGAMLPLSSFSVGGSAAADASQCDPGLKPRANHPFAYQPREDRCEGVYVQDISVPVLRLFAFSRGAAIPMRLSDVPVRLSWSLPEDAAIRIRAQSLRPRLYYRMDTLRPARTRTFSWPLDVAMALDLTGDEIGILAWAQIEADSDEMRLYVPIGVEPAESGVAATPTREDRRLRIGVVVGRELDEIFVRILRQVEGEDIYEVSQPRRSLALGYYPAGRAIWIDLPPPAKPGRYAVQIGAQQSDGGAATMEFAFLWAVSQTP